MQTIDSTTKGKAVHRKLQGSTTLSRKYVSRPKARNMEMVSVQKSPSIQRFNRKTATSAPIKKLAVSYLDDEVVTSQPTQTEQPFQPHPIQTKANQQMQMRSQLYNNQSVPTQPTARELKEQAIQKALAAANSTPGNTETKHKNNFSKLSFSFGRLVLALACTAVAVFAIVYFVNLNMPDISLKVAAMQSGINASYPAYVPRDYTISSITSEDKKIILDFSNSKENSGFTIVEEMSSWDSNALLNNYVKEAYGDNYSVIKEQGLTIYIDNGNATWTNGGIVYKISSTGEHLTNKQISTIATSL